MTRVSLTHDLVQPYAEELSGLLPLEIDSGGRRLKLALLTTLGIPMRLWMYDDTVAIECQRRDKSWRTGTVNDLDELLASAEEEGQLTPIPAPHAMTPHRRIIREARRVRHGVVNGITALQKDLHELRVLAASGQPIGAELLQFSMLTVSLAASARIHDAQLELLQDPPQ